MRIRSSVTRRRSDSSRHVSSSSAFDQLLLLVQQRFSLLQALQQQQELSLSLQAYLIKPVQRITKYQLLLTKLRDNCEEGTGKAEIAVSISNVV